MSSHEELVIRSPRLALAGLSDPRLGLEAARALARFLAAWQIPVMLYSDRAGGDPGRPWSVVRERRLSDLAAASERDLVPEPNRWAVANGGDFTLLAAAGSRDPLLELAALTSTPLVLVGSAADGSLGPAAEAGSLASRFEGLEIAGWLSFGAAGGHEEAGLRFFGALGPEPGGGEPEPEDPIAALDHAARADAAPAGIDVAGLLGAGNGAPVLVPPRHPSGRGNGSRPRVASWRSGGRGRALMLAGTHSSAGKSFLVTALARHFSNRGARVVPFKGQNMSNNSRVVAGGEIGVAQYLQALAARAEPEVRMNPVLLKPHDRGSHVVMLGRPDPELTALPWRVRKPAMWPVIRRALHELLEENDVVLIEGAGSPAESYMYLNDVVNLRVAREAGAATILIADAGRGGAIAQAYGTWRLIPPRDRDLIRGFLFNRFYPGGYTDLFLPGCAQLEELTGVPSIGILPELEFSLPDEDLHSLRAPSAGRGRRIAVLAYPRISNFDEFAALEHVPDVDVSWVKERAGSTAPIC